MNRIDLGLMTGVDLPIPECKIVIHQPTIKEISMVGEREYLQGIQVLCIQKRLDDKDLSNITNFQLFMTILSQEETKDNKEYVVQALNLLFPQYTVSFTPRSLLFNLNEETIIIDEDNFEQLQAVIRQICCLSGKSEDTFNPANDAAAEIAKKLMRGRERVAALKAAENDSSILGLYVSILTVGLHIPLDQIVNWTMYQLYDILERYSLFTSWDIDIRSRLAGGKSDSEPDNWMKVIH